MTDHKEDFLDLFADCELKIEYDADTNINGSQIDCSTFTLTGSLYSLTTFLETLSIKRSYEESWDDAIQRAVESLRE